MVFLYCTKIKIFTKQRAALGDPPPSHQSTTCRLCCTPESIL